MSTTRPRTIIISEIIQLLLLFEPLWRALRMDSVASVIGALVLVSIPAAIILSATRKRKIWARNVFAGLALISWLMATGIAAWELATGSALSDRELWKVEGFLTINLVAVALFFTDSAKIWFGQKPIMERGDSPASKSVAVTSMIKKIYDAFMTINAVGMVVGFWIIGFFGWCYWMWTAIQLGSFMMFFFGLLGPLAFVAAVLGLWSYTFGLPVWLLHMVS